MWQVKSILDSKCKHFKGQSWRTLDRRFVYCAKSLVPKLQIHTKRSYIDEAGQNWEHRTQRQQLEWLGQIMLEIQAIDAGWRQTWGLGVAEGLVAEGPGGGAAEGLLKGGSGGAGARAGLGVKGPWK